MENLMKILILEDMATDAYLIEYTLRKANFSFITKRVDTREEFIKAFDEFVPDVVLSDHSLPQFNSREALKIFKTKNTNIPFILVTGTVSEEFAVDCLKLGAHDYILKDNLTRLPSAITNSIKQTQTEREREEAIVALKKREEHFRSLIENSTDVINIVDKSGIIKYSSQSVRSVLGYEPEEFTGKEIFEYLHPQDIEKIKSLCQNWIKDGERTNTIEFAIRDKNNSWKWIEGIVKAYSPDGVTKDLIINSRDVSERKKTEELLKEQNAELEKINSELDRFVYSASHDLRAPLKSLLGLVKLAYMDVEKDDYTFIEKYLVMMEQSIGKLDNTIKDIIYYSRNSRMEIVKDEIDFNVLINEAFEKLRYMDGMEKIGKIVTIDNTEPFFSDKTRLSIVFNNIISNAIKYRDNRKESCLEITIHTDSEKALIVIKDNGIGISEKYIDKIFNMFYRATEQSEGSGLGLYIVKETIDKLQGKIQVKSVMREGTEFTIEVPSFK